MAVRAQRQRLRVAHPSPPSRCPSRICLLEPSFSCPLLSIYLSVSPSLARNVAVCRAPSVPLSHPLYHSCSLFPGPPQSSVLLWLLLRRCPSICFSLSHSQLRAPPLSAARERTTREILFYPLPCSNSLGFTGGGDTRHTRGTRSQRRARTHYRRVRERTLTTTTTTTTTRLRYTRQTIIQFSFVSFILSSLYFYLFLVLAAVASFVSSLSLFRSLCFSLSRN